MDHRGFTLIEIVLIIAVLFILAAVMYPSGDLEGIRASVVARKIVSDIRYAQQMANTTRVVHGIVFSAGSYTVFQNDNPLDPTLDPLKGGGYVVTMAGDFGGVTLVPALGVSPNHDVVKFDSLGRPFRRDGTPMDSANGNTVVVSGGAATHIVSIEPSSGMVTVN